MSDRRAALLRGVNVGTANRIAMSDLRRVFEDLGHRDVGTLLNSGNVAFTSGSRPGHAEAARIEKAIAHHCGVTTRVIVLTRHELAAAIEENPLAAATDPSRLLVMAFPDARTMGPVKALLEERWAPEALALGKRVAYLWCAKGIAGSRLWAAVGRAARDAGTARNIATLRKLIALMDKG